MPTAVCPLVSNTPVLGREITEFSILPENDGGVRWCFAAFQMSINPGEEAWPRAHSHNDFCLAVQRPNKIREFEMKQHQQLDGRLPVLQKQMAQPIETRNTWKRTLPAMLTLLRSKWIIAIVLVACLASQVSRAGKLIDSVMLDHPVSGSLPATGISHEPAASIHPAAFTTAKPAGPTEFQQSGIPTGPTPPVANHSLPAVQEPVDSLKVADSSTTANQLAAPFQEPDDEKNNRDEPNDDKTRLVKDAFFGNVFGVGSITISFDEETSPAVMPDQPIGVSDRDNRTSYGVATPLYRNKDDGDFHLAELTVQFLFRGCEPLDISLQTTGGSILPDGHIQVEDNQEEHRQLLDTWWARYSQQQAGPSGELDWIHRSVTRMLARRLDLSLPVDWSKNSQRRSMAKIEQDFERILGTLLGIDSMLIAMGQESTSPINTDLTADQSLPTAINIRSVPTSTLARGITIEPLAMHVPQECFYVRCGTLHNYEWLRGFVTHWNGSLEEIVKVASTDRSIRQRLEKQLALDLETCKRLGLDNEISDFALIGCDLNFDDGAAIGAVFEELDAGKVKGIIKEQRRRAVADNVDVRERTIKILGRPVSYVHSPGNVIRSFFVTMGNYHLVTNSEFIVRRFIESGDGNGSLGRLNEFQMARQKVPSAKSSVVQIYLSDPFFREFVSPKYRIETARRKQAVEELRQLALARAIASAEGIGQISRQGLMDLEYLPWQFNQRADESKAQFAGSTVNDTVRGTWGTFKPVADMELDRATRAEVAEYQRFATLYQQQWQQMDPVVANLSVSPNALEGTETVELDILVVPFARQRYEVFNRYLASMTSREIDTRDDDLIAVTAGLHSPMGGTMLTRMGIHDEAIEYRIGNGQVVTSGTHSGRTLASSNQYVLVDSSGIDGLRRLGDFVQSMQGNSPVPARTSRSTSYNAFSLLFVLPRLLGSIAKAEAIETQENWTIMSPRNDLRKKIVNLATVQPKTGKSQVRFRMMDIQRSQAYEYINAYTYMEMHKVSAANAALLNYVSQQLPLSVEQAPDLIEQVCGVKLVCPLGREYRMADRTGYRYWTAQADDGGSYFEIAAVPEDYSFPFLSWLRGMELEFNLAADTLTSKVRLTTKQTLPGSSSPHSNPRASDAEFIGGADGR